jgi:tetratricopeptide (TPR) repeat protein
LLLTQDKAEEALSIVDAGLDKDPENPALLANRALALDVLGKPEALGAYKALLDVAPDDAANRFNYAVLLAASDKKQEALAQLAKIRAGDAALLMDTAQLYGRLEAYDSCVEVLDVALGQGKSSELLVHRARCKHSAGDDSGALADLEAAVTLEADNPIGHYYLGRHLMATGKIAEGKKELRRAVELGPETPFGKAAARDLAK